MNAEDLRRLKHELRTPVNHILGYSDLLLETVGDSGDRVTASVAKDIHGSGQILAKLLERSLLSPSGEIGLRSAGCSARDYPSCDQTDSANLIVEFDGVRD